jgi:hypothetical protein
MYECCHCFPDIGIAKHKKLLDRTIYVLLHWYNLKNLPTNINGPGILFSAKKQLLPSSQSPEWNRPALLSEKTNTVSIDICETYHSGFEIAPHLRTTKLGHLFD